MFSTVAVPFYISTMTVQGGFQSDMICKHFLEFCELFFIQLRVSFDELKFSILMKFNLSIIYIFFLWLPVLLVS